MAGTVTRWFREEANTSLEEYFQACPLVWMAATTSRRVGSVIAGCRSGIRVDAGYHSYGLDDETVRMVEGRGFPFANVSGSN
jgi:hypothetical protein